MTMLGTEGAAHSARTDIIDKARSRRLTLCAAPKASWLAR